MRPHLREWVRLCARELDCSEPIVEVGALVPPGQEELADLRPLFAGRRDIGCDMQAGPGVDRVEDLHALKFDDGEVGTFLLVNTYEHVRDPIRAMAEVRRALRPGGVVIYTSVMFFPIHGYPNDYWRFTPEAGIDWPADGYRLFEIAALAGSSKHGCFEPPAECNCLFLERRLFDRLDGFDEAFDLPGGGLVNHDFYRRAVETTGTTLLCLLGEASFHQHHGGVSTARDEAALDELWQRYCAQYAGIRQRPYRVPERRPMLFGEAHPRSLTWLRLSGELATASASGSFASPGQPGTGIGADSRNATQPERLLAKLTEWMHVQSRELEGQREMLRSLEEQLGERTRWLRIQDEILHRQIARIDALEALRQPESGDRDDEP